MKVPARKRVNHVSCARMGRTQFGLNESPRPKAGKLLCVQKTVKLVTSLNEVPARRWRNWWPSCPPVPNVSCLNESSHPKSEKLARLVSFAHFLRPASMKVTTQGGEIQVEVITPPQLRRLNESPLPKAGKGVDGAEGCRNRQYLDESPHPKAGKS